MCLNIEGEREKRGTKTTRSKSNYWTQMFHIQVHGSSSLNTLQASYPVSNTVAGLSICCYFVPWHVFADQQLQQRLMQIMSIEKTVIHSYSSLSYFSCFKVKQLQAFQTVWKEIAGLKKYWYVDLYFAASLELDHAGKNCQNWSYKHLERHRQRITETGQVEADF